MCATTSYVYALKSELTYADDTNILYAYVSFGVIGIYPSWCAYSYVCIQYDYIDW